MEKIYLGLDPGKQNFFYAIISTEKGVIENGQLPTITTFDPNEVRLQLVNFQAFYLSLLSKHHYSMIIAERFQNRGTLALGAAGEYINMMLGIILSLTYTAKQSLYFTPAVIWKNYFKKNFGTNDTFELFEKKWNRHTSDAIGMALYYAIRHDSFEKSLSILSKPDNKIF